MISVTERENCVITFQVIVVMLRRILKHGLQEDDLRDYNLELQE